MYEADNDSIETNPDKEIFSKKKLFLYADSSFIYAYRARRRCAGWLWVKGTWSVSNDTLILNNDNYSFDKKVVRTKYIISAERLVIADPAQAKDAENWGNFISRRKEQQFSL